ncbi:ATPase [Maritimibacter sp. 55A14]|uniref:ATP12 family chaperone protein n=1 Tax=Maritimibacter sp. 55A14 TaxID=2174844 RepID=UPI000D61E179|nr:ATP12 family protein [Maritimibacter sp. 55A14]PWE32723.1 ATPase [Maritimibacter sp. 55A14]
MTEWKMKRFWSEARAEPAAAGFAILLDGRPVKTPAKAGLCVPTRTLADAVAAEWDAQSGPVRPETMPLTRAANAAIDKVAIQQAEVAAMLAEYGRTDLICYRAEGPNELVRRQEAAWDPLLAWSAEEVGAPLVPTTGVVHIRQPAASLERFAEEVRGFDAFGLTALHDLVTLSGSLVIGLAALRGAFDGDDLWQRSRIDEIWQQEQWGEDAEASQAAARKEAAFAQALEFFRLCRR